MKYLAIAILIVLTASSSYTIKDESSILNQFWNEIVQEKENSPVWGKGGGGVLGLIFAGYVRWPLRAPTPILWPIIDPISVTFGQICNFRDPNLVTFYFYELTHFFRLNEEHFTF